MGSGGEGVLRRWSYIAKWKEQKKGENIISESMLFFSLLGVHIFFFCFFLDFYFLLFLIPYLVSYFPLLRPTKFARRSRVLISIFFFKKKR